MGPRTLVRGNQPLRQVYVSRTRQRFNGAAHSRARKSNEGGEGEVGCLASMGPRTLVRGNAVGGLFAIFVIRLQWGRALSCAEICGNCANAVRVSSFNGAAHSRARK